MAIPATPGAVGGNAHLFGSGGDSGIDDIGGAVGKTGMLVGNAELIGNGGNRIPPGGNSGRLFDIRGANEI
ncbi:hypothetical protein MUBE_12335 [Mycobacterium uberis]|uniref:Uncharacterized protein n=1 Tax=Mycobacterium uberis TaxID=2162698 RepID=A0A3E1HE28_9MYCO|nr:hypothetical protein [Mycobacterium uberis]RFD24693.1 hypothetical protein MUBE_12335 [Mycobacterium uberis]